MNAKRIEKQFQILRIIVAVSLALLIALLIIILVSDIPLEAIKYLIIGPFTTIRRLGNVVEAMIPLLFTGVSVCLMYSANQINMAAEGAFFIGAVGATGIAIINPPFLSGLHPLISILVGGLVGTLITSVPAILHIRYKAQPVVSSLMMNYISLFMGIYFIRYHFYDETAGYLCSLPFKDTATLSNIMTGTSIHSGLFIGILVVILGYIYMYYTKSGYALRIVGMNQSFAKYSGIKVNSVILSCQLIGGFIAGAGGAVEVLGMYERFQYSSLTSHGFDGILIAILAKYNPLMVPISALFLAYIRVGADIMARMTDVTVEIVYIIQAVIIIFVASEHFLSKWKHRKMFNSAENSSITEEVS